MSISARLSKGYSSIRGANNIPRRASFGGELAQNANRLYMLTIKKESLNNKQILVKKQLSDIQEQLKKIDAEIQTRQSNYNRLSPHKRKKMNDRKEMKQKFSRGVELKY